MKTTNTPEVATSWQNMLMEMMPEIRRYLRILLWRICHNRDEREEAIQDCVANICKQFARLCIQGKHEQATASTLAKYAFRHWVAGRNICGTSQKYNAIRRGDSLPTFEPLPEFDLVAETPCNAFVDNARFATSDVACFRIDYSTWNQSLSEEEKAIVSLLADGHRPCEVKRILDIQAWQVYETRERLSGSWDSFQEQASLR